MSTPKSRRNGKKNPLSLSPLSPRAAVTTSSRPHESGLVVLLLAAEPPEKPRRGKESKEERESDRDDRCRTKLDLNSLNLPASSARAPRPTSSATAPRSGSGSRRPPSSRRRTRRPSMGSLVPLRRRRRRRTAAAGPSVASWCTARTGARSLWTGGRGSGGRRSRRHDSSSSSSESGVEKRRRRRRCRPPNLPLLCRRPRPCFSSSTASPGGPARAT